MITELKSQRRWRRRAFKMDDTSIHAMVDAFVPLLAPFPELNQLIKVDRIQFQSYIKVDYVGIDAMNANIQIKDDFADSGGGTFQGNSRAMKSETILFPSCSLRVMRRY